MVLYETLLKAKYLHFENTSSVDPNTAPSIKLDIETKY